MTMFPNEKARLMRMMDAHGVPAVSATGAKMDFTQRVEWLIEHQKTAALAEPRCPACGEYLVEDDCLWSCANPRCESSR